MRNRPGRRRGIGAVEFVMVVIPTVFLTTSIFEMSMTAWEYHSMAYAIEVAGRYACSHGRTCAKGGNSCTIRVEDVVNTISKNAPALNTSSLNVTLTTHASSVPCSPLTNCTSNASQFPNSTDNGVGNDITITASYPMNNPIPMFWFGAGSSGSNSWTFGATSKCNIVY